MMMTSSLRHVLEEEGTAVNLAAVLNAAFNPVVNVVRTRRGRRRR